MKQDKYLKSYLKDNFDFKSLKKAGFFSKEIKSTDYAKQAERICYFFDLKNIYDWSTSKPVDIINPVGIETGEIQNKFSADILGTMFQTKIKKP